MIPVQTIVDRVTSILDAEGSDRYLTKTLNQPLT